MEPAQGLREIREPLIAWEKHVTLTSHQFSTINIESQNGDARDSCDKLING